MDSNSVGVMTGIVAILIAIMTGITQAIGLRNKARTTTTDMLTTQLDILRVELAEMKESLTGCHRSLTAVNEENERLMRRILSLPNEDQVAKVLESAAVSAKLVLAEATQKAAEVLAEATKQAAEVLSATAKHNAKMS